MDLDLTKQWITRWEGTRSRTYRDTRNIPTIGVGFNLTTSAAKPAIESLGLDFDQVVSGTILLTADQIDQLLTSSIQAAMNSARALVSNFDDLPADQQLVVIDLAFNMGQHTLGQFVNTLRCIEQQDWQNASNNLQQSAWFTEVGPRPTQRGGADVAVLGGACTAASVLGIEPQPGVVLTAGTSAQG